MRLRTRLVLLIAIASLGPLGILGLGSTRVAAREMSAKVAELQGQTTEGLARYVDTWLDLQLRLVGQQLRAFPVAGLEETFQLGFLRLVYQQVPEVQIASLLDSRGLERVPSVYRAEGDGQWPERDEVTLDRLGRFRRALPAANPGEQAALGRPYTPPGRAAPVLPVALVAPEAAELVLAVELALDPVVRELGAAAGAERDVVLLDGAGGTITGGAAGLVDAQVFRPFLRGVTASDVRYTAPDGRDVLASCGAVQRAGWLVVVAEPLSLTTELAQDEIFARTGVLAVIAASLSLVLGVLFARQVSGPVVALKEAALAVAEGHFGRRVPPPVEGELAELTRAFNFMSGRLERNRREIDAKNQEIAAFNRELQARVDERTRELREAQDRLVRSARLAAAGEMGAGLAHELNNPLAGVLGLVQVLLVRAADRDLPLLRAAEEQALRCRDIVARLLRFTEPDRPSAPLETAARPMVDLHGVVGEVVELVLPSFRQRGVGLAWRSEGPLPVRGDRKALAQALAQLLASLRAAAVPGSTVGMEGRTAPGSVELRIDVLVAETTAKKDDWMASGLGFWGAQQVFAELGGNLVEPAEQAGATGPRTWRVVLPQA